MGSEYLQIEIEGKTFHVDLEFLNPKDFKLKLGKMNNNKTEFTSEKVITLKGLQEGGFKL